MFSVTFRERAALYNVEREKFSIFVTDKHCHGFAIIIVLRVKNFRLCVFLFAIA